jgi:hypothetical protein
MLKSVAVVFGVIVFAIGVLGFIPQVTEEGKLLGIFHVNDAHNLIHVLTGLIGIYCGTKGECASRLFFKVFGVVYAMIAALGFYYGDLPILGVIANNSADNILHVVIAVVALYLGFGCCGAQSGCCNGGSCSTKPKEPN